MNILIGGRRIDESKQRRHMRWKEENTQIIKSSGLSFTEANSGESLLFREPNKPKADFYPSTGRWRVAGVKKTFRGGASLFINWYTKQ